MSSDAVLSNIRVTEILEMARAGSLNWSDLTAEEKEFVKTVKMTCSRRGCGEEFKIYDSRQGRIRHYCSNGCARKARRIGKWECVICGRALRHPMGLQLHIKACHPDLSEHDYVKSYLEHNGRDTTYFLKKCPHCGEERKLNFTKARYEQCRCQKLEADISRYERQLREINGALQQESDPAKRSKLGHKKGWRVKMLNSARSSLDHLTPSGDNLGQGPLSSILSCSRIDILYRDGGYFEALLRQNHEVYNAYYRMMSFVGVNSSITDQLKRASERLTECLKRYGWSKLNPGDEGLYLYVYMPEETNQGNSGLNWTIWKVETSYSRPAFKELRQSLKFESSELKEFLGSHGSLFSYPWTSNPFQICWHSLVYIEETKSVVKLNPYSIMKVHQYLNESKD